MLDGARRQADAAVPASAWLPFGCGPADSRARLFCLPFAGGGASNFWPWRALVPGVPALPLQYPGHETRIDEAPLSAIDPMLDGLAGALAPLLDRPYLLFGYSMGARLAYALVARLARCGLPPPCALMVAAHRPPDRPSAAPDPAGLPDPALLQVLRDYGGMPDELLDDPDFRAHMLPLVRADFTLARQPVALDPVPCPVVAYAGSGDRTAAAAAMAHWAAFTRDRFVLREFDGGHFFLRSAGGFAAQLRADVLALVPGGSGLAPGVR